MVIGYRLAVDRDPVFSFIRDEISRLIELIDIVQAQIHIALSGVVECVELKVCDHAPLFFGELDLLLAVLNDPGELRRVKMMILQILQSILIGESPV